MSPAVSFKSVVVVTSQGVRLWTLNRKVWSESKAKLSLDSAPSSEAIALTQGSNLLVLVSDAYTGHLQFVAPNKKEELTDEALGQRLQNDYQIDVGSYEFAMQRSNLTRTEMQVSVSGIEAAIYAQVQSLIAALQPRKSWVMPLGWFLSPLKSVEPVLLAVVGPKDQVYVSHHYLGVDDARELTLSELTEYVQSRKEERKETHLLYIQAPARTFKKLESSLAELVAVHPLVPDASGDPLTEVITEVMNKGTDVLSELLHFEDAVSEVAEESTVASTNQEDPDVAVATVTTVTETVSVVSPAMAPGPVISGLQSSDDLEFVGGEESEMADSSDSADSSEDTDTAGDLPQPRLPQPSAPVAPPVSTARTRVAVTQEVIDPEETSDRVDVVEVKESTTSVVTSVAPAVAAAMVEEELEAPFVEEQIDHRDALSRLAAEKVSDKSNQRYREVAQTRSWGIVALVFVAVVAATVLVGGAIFWSQQPQPQQNALIPSETQPTPTPSPTPTPTPQPETLTLAEKAQLTTTVVNATSRAGLAGRYQAALKTAGWNVPTAGNARGTYTEAAVYIFTENEAAFQTLSREFEGVSVRRMTENSEGTAATVDVVIVVNQAVEPDITPADEAPAASGSATAR